MPPAVASRARRRWPPLLTPLMFRQPDCRLRFRRCLSAAADVYVFHRCFFAALLPFTPVPANRR
jgi:hypothetical protein